MCCFYAKKDYKCTLNLSNSKNALPTKFVPVESGSQPGTPPVRLLTGIFLPLRINKIFL